MITIKTRSMLLIINEFVNNSSQKYFVILRDVKYNVPTIHNIIHKLKKE